MIVDNSLFLGAVAGVVASAGFVYVEIGRYAAPQVPRSLFDERRTFFGYTAGLFVGIVLLTAFLLFTTSLFVGGGLGAILFLAILVATLEIGQYLIGRSVYFGSDTALPFYVVSYRAGAAGLLGIGVVSDYLVAGSYSVVGLVANLILALAFVLLLAAAGIQSTPSGPRDARRPGSFGRGLLLELLGFLLVGLGPLGGDVGVLTAAVAVAGGSAGLYLRRRDEVFGAVRPPAAGAPDDRPPVGRFGRRDRKGSV